ncbi:MAG TPA: sulfite exporter TauE/SafE family protein [Ktedonobacterales bacterium]|jgi:hypothetical protein
MTLVQAGLLVLAAFVAGALNAVAGGGTFISYPALVFTGVPLITSSATSSVALLPGMLASAGAYRKSLKVERGQLLLQGGIGVVGGLLGAVLLLHTPSRTFALVLPFLLLLATLLFAFGPRLTARLRQRTPAAARAPWVGQAFAAVTLLIFAIYGGFFGGGMSILILALLSITGMTNIHQMNALKTILNSTINVMAVIAFIVLRAVWWPQALVMMVGSIAGGFGGAAVAQRLDPRVVRGFVIVVGMALSTYFFVAQYFFTAQK